MNKKKFDPKKISVLNNPNRLKDIPLDFIISNLKLEKDKLKKIVDIGAGTGFFAIHFLKYLNKGKILACDISDIMLKWMRDNVCNEHRAIYPIKIEESLIPIKDKCIDFVYMINLHHELEFPEQMLKECFRILKDYRKICIIDWKKEFESQGPPKNLRCDPVDVEEQMKNVGFKRVVIFNNLLKHFMLIGEKMPQS